MATQVSLNSGAVASAGALALQTNGTTQAVSISTGQVATLAQNPILTSGTINGVAYLNGSNALTTGSALTFDGTVVNNTGVAPNFRSTITGGSYYTNLSADGIYASGTDLYLYAPASKFISFYAAGAEKMRLGAATGGVGALGIGYTSLTSVGDNGLAVLGNVGIGTSSPARKLSVSSGSTSAAYIQLCNTTSGIGVGQGFEVFSDGTNAGLINRQNGYLEFDTNNIERARIDSSGNLLQKGATTAAGIKPTALANNESITTVNSTTYTINLGTSAKLFWIALGNGDGALVFTSYISSSITFLGITPTTVAATASPSSAQLGISKSANSHDIVIKTGSALSSTAASWQMGVLSSQVA
jgi:hypothetical protein